MSYDFERLREMLLAAFAADREGLAMDDPTSDQQDADIAVETVLRWLATPEA